jgi:hypothetical protein
VLIATPSDGDRFYFDLERSVVIEECCEEGKAPPMPKNAYERVEELRQATQRVPAVSHEGEPAGLATESSEGEAIPLPGSGTDTDRLRDADLKRLIETHHAKALQLREAEATAAAQALNEERAAAELAKVLEDRRARLRAQREIVRKEAERLRTEADAREAEAAELQRKIDET